MTSVPGTARLASPFPWSAVIGQERLKLALLKAHFQQRRNVSDREVLLDVAEAEGFDRARAAAAESLVCTMSSGMRSASAPGSASRRAGSSSTIRILLPTSVPLPGCPGAAAW